MFQLSALADHGGLAIALCLRGFDAQRGHATLAQQPAEFGADFDQVGQVIGVTPGIGVGDDRHGHGLAGGGGDGAAHLGMGFLDPDGQFADIGAHLSPSFPVILSAARPPARLWTRGPVVMTSISAISSARGASFRPSSIASK